MTRTRLTLDVNSKQGRAEHRKLLGPLRDIVLNPSTVTRYEKACKLFFEWLVQQGMPIPAEVSVFDSVLSEFVCHLWEEGDGRALASNVLAGMQHFSPPLRRNMPCAWRLLHAWHRREMPARAPPLTEELTHALCGAALAKHRGDLCVLLCVAFHCMLRTGEALSLHADRITFNAACSSAVISLGLTKTGQRRGALESVTVDEPYVAKLLKALCVTRGSDFLLSTSAAEFRKTFKELCQDLGIVDWGFKPYSLRRGGATHHFRVGGNLGATIIRGRWGSASAARIYLNDGLATLASFRFEDSQRIKRFIKRFATACSA